MDLDEAKQVYVDARRCLISALHQEFREACVSLEASPAGKPDRHAVKSLKRVEAFLETESMLFRMQVPWWNRTSVQRIGSTLLESGRSSVAPPRTACWASLGTVAKFHYLRIRRSLKRLKSMPPGGWHTITMRLVTAKELCRNSFTDLYVISLLGSCRRDKRIYRYKEAFSTLCFIRVSYGEKMEWPEVGLQ